MVDKVFSDQLGRNIKAYMDDMLVKYKSFKGHIWGLQEVFLVLIKILEKYKLF